MTRHFSWLAVTLAAGLAMGCAPSTSPTPAAPASLAELEALRTRRAADPAVLARLGAAYYAAHDYAKARDVLLTARTLAPTSYPTLVYLGLAYEELGDLDSARASYTAAGRLADANGRRREIDTRLVALTRKELQQAARDAVAREAELGTQAPEPNAVAVFPFRYAGTDTTLRPLGRGLTYLVIEDLSKVPRLRLLERERVQALVDELKLVETGRVDPATGARSGRLLRAGRVIQGSLGDAPNRRLRLDANLVDARNASIVGRGTGTDRIQQLFDVEKQVVLQLLGRMGIALTPAEEQAISQRPTTSLQAFLAFSRGLEASDRGDYRAAAEAFGAAAREDVAFGEAKQLGLRSEALSDPGVTREPELEPLDLRGVRDNTTEGSGTLLRDALDGVVPDATARGDDVGPPTDRVSLPEALGEDDPTRAGIFGDILIQVDRP